MHPDLLQTLRCPIDPDRTALLVQERDQVVCQKCQVRFPVKQGIPVLIAAECDLPGDKTELSQLPCQRRMNRRQS